MEYGRQEELLGSETKAPASAMNMLMNMDLGGGKPQVAPEEGIAQENEKGAVEDSDGQKDGQDVLLSQRHQGGVVEEPANF